MRYYLDCEFNGMGGELLSLALVCEDGHSLYLIHNQIEEDDLDPWVAANVVPLLYQVPDYVTRGGDALTAGYEAFSHQIEIFLQMDRDPIIICDWPDDFKYLCQLLITGPGEAIKVPGMKFEWHRVDAYPTTLPGAIQHNAYWDAMALRHKLAKPAAVTKPNPAKSAEQAEQL